MRGRRGEVGAGGGTGSGGSVGVRVDPPPPQAGPAHRRDLEAWAVVGVEVHELACRPARASRTSAHCGAEGRHHRRLQGQCQNAASLHCAATAERASPVRLCRKPPALGAAAAARDEPPPRFASVLAWLVDGMAACWGCWKWGWPKGARQVRLGLCDQPIERQRERAGSCV